MQKVVYGSAEDAKSGIRKCRGCKKWYTEVSSTQKVVYASVEDAKSGIRKCSALI